MPSSDSGNQPPTARQVAENCPLSDEATSRLTSEVPPGKYVAMLIANQLYADAIRFTAFSFTKREAVWWGMLCLWEADRTDPDAVSAAAHQSYQSLLAWLQDPSEANRRAVEAAGRLAGITTPHGQLAMAAFFSEGSMSLPDQPEVEPSPWLTAKNVASVVLAASKQGTAAQIAESQRRYLVLAAELTTGQLPWQTREETMLASTSH
jgi:hypothetical protein